MEQRGLAEVRGAPQSALAYEPGARNRHDRFLDQRDGDRAAERAPADSDRDVDVVDVEVRRPAPGAQPHVDARMASLRELNLYPDAKSWSTTDTELKVSTRLMSPTELGGSEPNPAMYLGRGLTILLHDSLMNNSLDRFVT